MRIETAVLATDITGTFEHAVLHACGSNDGEVAWRHTYFGYAIMTPKAMRWSRSASARQQAAAAAAEGHHPSRHKNGVLPGASITAAHGHRLPIEIPLRSNVFVVV